MGETGDGEDGGEGEGGGEDEGGHLAREIRHPALLCGGN